MVTKREMMLDAILTVYEMSEEAVCPSCGIGTLKGNNCDIGDTCTECHEYFHDDYYVYMLDDIVGIAFQKEQNGELDKRRRRNV